MLLWLLLASKCVAKGRFQHRDAALSIGFANSSTAFNGSAIGPSSQSATSQSISIASSITVTTGQALSTAFDPLAIETNSIASFDSASSVDARITENARSQNASASCSSCALEATTKTSVTGNVLLTMTNQPNASFIRSDDIKVNETSTPLSGYNISISARLRTGGNSQWSSPAPFTYPNASFFNETSTSAADDPSSTDGASSTTACPTTYASDYEPTKRGHDACEWLARRYDGDNLYGTYYGGDCLGAYCSASFWKTAVPNYTGDEYSTLITTLTWFDQHVGSLATVTSTWSYYFTEVLPWSPPCCALCEISAPEVEFIFWPDQVGGQSSNASSFSSYVDETGFTFIYPSVYVAFTSLAASDRCGTVGEMIPLTTLAFDLSEISTLMVTETLCPRSDVYSFLGWSPDLFPDFHPETIPFNAWLTRPMVIADVAQNCSTIPGYTYNTYNSNDPSDPNIDNGIGDPCHPWLDLPDRIKTLQARWSNCQLNVYTGLIDPPRTLHPVNVLVPTATSATSTPGVPTVIATPGQSIPDGPRQTSQPATSISTSKEVDPPTDPQQTGNSAATAPSKTLTSIPLVTVTLPSGRPPPRPSSSLSSSSVITLPDLTAPVTILLPPATKSGSKSAQVITIIPVPVDPNDPHETRPSTAPPLVVVAETKTQTLVPGSAITIGGTTSTDSENHVTVVSGTKLVLDPPQSTQDGTKTLQVVPLESSGPQVFIPLGSETITATGSIGSSLVIDDQTLFPGSSITIGGSRWIEGGKTTILGGTEISLGPGATVLIVDHSSSVPLSAALFMTESLDPSVLILGSSTFTEEPLGWFVIDGQTLLPGSTMEYHGTILSMDSQGTVVVVGGSSTVHLDNAHATTAITFDGTAYTLAVDSSIVIDGSTITLPNGQVTITGGQTLSLDAAGSFVIVKGTMTSTLVSANPTADPGSLPSDSFVRMTSGPIDVATVPGNPQPSASDRKKNSNAFRERTPGWSLFSGFLLWHLGMHAA